MLCDFPRQKRGLPEDRALPCPAWRPRGMWLNPHLLVSRGQKEATSNSLGEVSEQGLEPGSARP